MTASAEAKPRSPEALEPWPLATRTEPPVLVDPAPPIIIKSPPCVADFPVTKDTEPLIVPLEVPVVMVIEPDSEPFAFALFT